MITTDKDRVYIELGDDGYLVSRYTYEMAQTLDNPTLSDYEQIANACSEPAPIPCAMTIAL